MVDIILLKNTRREVEDVLLKDDFFERIKKNKLQAEYYSEIQAFSFEWSDKYEAVKDMGYPWVILKKGETFSLKEWCKVARERYNRTNNDLFLVGSLLSDRRFNKVSNNHSLVA